MKRKKQNKLPKIIKRKNFYLYSIILGICLNFTPLHSFETRATATQDADQVREKNITDWDARLEYARLLSNLQRYNEAMEQYQKLLKEKPDSNVVQVEIAQVLYYQGKHREALEILEKIPSEALNDKTRLQMAEIYQVLKEYALAESIYREQLEKHPKSYLVQFKLADLLSWQKRYEESILLYQQILADNPNDIQVRRKYAMVLIWMGKESEAAKELEKTLKD